MTSQTYTRYISWNLFMLVIVWSCLDISLFAIVPTSRRALVLGNDSYPGNRLANARNDARSMASELKSLGYVTTLLLDGNRENTSRYIENFVDSISNGDTALVYYAGHGFQMDGENYLVPIDFHAVDGVDAKIQGYSLSALLDKLIAHGASTQVVILDACRDNPFGTVRGTQAGWAKTATSAGSFLAFGTSPGSTASDDPSENHGLFTKSVLQFMDDPSLNIEELFQKVRREVILASKMTQVPWTASSLIGSFHIAPTGDANRTVVDEPSVGVLHQESDNSNARAISVRASQEEVLGSNSIDLLNEAQANLRAFHFESAVKVLNNLLLLDPRSAIAMHLLGIALHLCGRGVEARQILDEAIKLNPTDYEAYAYRCVMDAGHKVDDANKFCRKAIDICESCSLGHLGLAMNLLRLGRSVDAYAESNRAVMMSPEEAPSVSLRARIEEVRGKRKLADEDYRKAMQLATTPRKQGF